ncbi:MAG: FKBP-type peptidyl-prolyl cis-trans isomerase [Methanoregula sp.]|nr:FKBP-type peptidyl-prolyl cis-trans isomerase [Methanoregula sp.]
MSKPDKKEKKTSKEKEDEIAGARTRNYILIAAGVIVIVAIAVAALLTLFNPVGAMKGDNVSMYFTLMYENGTVISTNFNGTPVEVTVGDPESIPGLSDAIAGMGVNQKKTVLIPFDKAYGPYRSDLIRVVNRTGLIASTNFTEGQLFTIRRKTDNAISVVRILNITPSTVTWDENHPLAGQNLMFTVQVVSLKKGAGVQVAKTPLPALTPVITVRETMDNATKNFSASVEQSGRS